MYRVFSPKKLVKKRGGLTRPEVARRSGGVLNEQDIYAYEQGKYRPSDRKLAGLMKAFGCSWDDLSEPKKLHATA